MSGDHLGIVASSRGGEPSDDFHHGCRAVANGLGGENETWSWPAARFINGELRPFPCADDAALFRLAD
jgi:hypothetical protein